MSISTDTYTHQYLQAELQQLEALGGTFKTKLFIDWFDNLDDFFKNVDRQDIIQKLQSLKSSDVSVSQWSPVKLEGFHSLHLEKSMRIRFANYDETTGMSNVKSLYVDAGLEAQDLANYVSSFEDGALNWTTS